MNKKWQGRIDGTEKEHLRWHQVVKSKFDNVRQDSVGIIGFASDEGVKRNKGRVGAAQGPDILRKFCSNFPAPQNTEIFDYGNVEVENNQLELAQKNLTDLVGKILISHDKSIVFGGGHEVLFGHFNGIRNAFPNKKIGIINFDAHFDNREMQAEIGATSGTGFWQIAQCDSNYQYLAVGIQRNSNTEALFKTAKKDNTTFILAEDFDLENSEKLILQFIDQVEIVYLTVCLDVFAAAFAPGVSAPAYCGIFPDAYFKNIFKLIAQNPKLKAFDVAELNPNYDIDNHTARLAASLVFEVIMA